MIRGSRQRRQRGFVALWVALFCGPFLPTAAHAQGAESGVLGAIHATVGATSVKGKATGFWGVGGRLRLGDYRLGGSGYVTGGAEFVADGSGLSIDLGYGGVELDAPFPWVSAEGARWLLLVGGGSGAVIERISDRELGADNFVVLEPRVSFSRRLAEVAEGSIAVGYRAALGVDDLPGVGSLALSGPTISLSISAPILRRQ